MQRPQFLKPIIYFLPIALIAVFGSNACKKTPKSDEIRVIFSEIPENPKWFFIFYANRDSGRTDEDTYEYAFGNGNVVMVDTNDPDLPDKVQVYHKGKPLDKEIKLNYIGENEHKGIRYRNYSTLVAQPEFEFSDSTNPNANPRSAHSDYWYYQSKKVEEVFAAVEAILAK